MDNKTEKIILKKISKYCESYGAKKTILNFEEDILKLNNPFLSYWFAGSIKGANIKALEKIVLESKDSEWCYRFSKEVNISKHLQEKKDINSIKQLVKTLKNK